MRGVATQAMRDVTDERDNEAHPAPPHICNRTQSVLTTVVGSELLFTTEERSSDPRLRDVPSIRFRRRRCPLHSIATPLSAPQSLENRRAREPDGPLFNDPAGEYLPVAFLRDGSIAMATPIPVFPERVGFTWWRFR